MSKRQPPTSPSGPASPPLALAWRVAIPLALFVAALASFWPSLSQGFIELDDDANFLLNERFRGLDAEHLAWMWSLDGFHYGHWHPLTWTSFALDYELYDGPQGLPSHDLAIGAKYHRISLVVHALSVVALYWLALGLLRWTASARELGKSDRGELALRVCAALAALAWGLHPLRVESVVWATERRDVLSTFFLILCVLAYLRLARHPAQWLRWIALALVAYSASLLSKAWGMTLPVVLLALDVYPLRRVREDSPAFVGWKRIVLEKLAFVPLAAATAWLAFLAQKQIGAVMNWTEHGLWNRFAQACYGLVFYPWKTLWPSDLSCLYLLELDFRPDKPVYLAAQAIVIIVTLALVLLRKRFPALLATWFCYGVLVSPVLGLSQSGAQKVADRYAYLATIPFSLLLGAGVLWWLARSGAALRTRTLIALGASVVLAAVLGVASFAQTRVWKDSESVFRHALAIEPHNYFMAHNLTVQLWKQNRMQEAVVVEEQSVAAHPKKGNEEARFTLGQLYQMTGKADLAFEQFRAAVAIEPGHTKSLQALVGELQRRGDEAGAVAACESVIAARPMLIEAWGELANVRVVRNNVPAALDVWRRQLERTHAGRGLPDAARAAGLPPSAAVSNQYARSLIAAGDVTAAEPYFINAVQLDPRNIEYATDAALGFLLLGRDQEAGDLLRQVTAAAPTHLRARSLLTIASRSGVRR